MRHRHAAAMLAGILLSAAAAHAQGGASPSPLVAIGNGATTPLCKRLAAVAESLSGGSGPSTVKAIPEHHLGAPFARFWQPAQASQLTPDLIRLIAIDRYRAEAQRELDSQKPLGAPGTTIPPGRYDARAEEIGIAKIRAAIAEGKLVVEHGTVDLTGTGKPSTALHIGIRTDAQQAYHHIDWTVHLIPDAFSSREEADKPSLIGVLRNDAVARYSDIVRYGGKDYVINAAMAARTMRLNAGGNFGMATVCEGTARLTATRSR